MTTSSPWSTLRQIATRRTKPAAEQCAVCAAVLAPAHEHVAEMSKGGIVCACPACAILFPSRGEGRFKRIPRDVVRPSDFDSGGELWMSLSIPVDLAFLFYSTPSAKPLAVYPSPAGPVFAPLGVEAWTRITAALGEAVPILADVQALLIRRTPGASDAIVVPIDRAFELVGRLRLHWKGISGGSEVQEEIHRFFQSLDERSGGVRRETHV